MRLEISALFYVIDPSEQAVQSAAIGNGIYIQKMNDEWIEAVKSQCPKVDAREQLERHPYTHRIFYEIPVQEPETYFSDKVTATEKQPLFQAIALSRIVKPTAIAYDNVWVKSFYLDSGEVEHYSEPHVGAYSVAYVSQPDVWNILRDEDVSLMAQLWDSLVYLLNNEPNYRRVVRALKYYELAHAIYFTELNHPIFHSALESLICTGHRNNQAQVTQRLPQLVSFVTSQQAEAIYSTCCDFKHAAQALQQVQTNTGRLMPSDQVRLDATILLRRVVRELLLEALRDRSFADLLSNPSLLRQRHQVFDRRGHLV
jgi:hypothetical protein